MKLTQQEALVKLQATILEILDAFSAFCEAHGLPWFLGFGTALGALRHDGFIPWDDDADVGMLREDYERFLEIVGEEGFVPGFSVHNARNTPNFDGIMTKIFKDGTKFHDQRAEDEGFDQGIFIDVFPYDRLLADPAAAKRQILSSRLWLYLLYLRGSGDVRVPHKGSLGATERVVCALANPLVRLCLSRDRILRGFDKNIPGPEAQVEDIWVPLPYREENPTSILLPTVPHAFHDRTYPVPANADAYLRIIYGDWHQLPPEEDRKSHLPVLIDFGDGSVYAPDKNPRDASDEVSLTGTGKPKVSVIIPTYNTGPYFEKATSSVLGQAYPAIELILVDDGSTDGTAEACDLLAAKDDRVIAIHQQNAGTSAARNTGIQAATGDYLTFLDHDDFWFDPSGLESAMEQTIEEPVDVIMHHVVDFDDGKQEYQANPSHLKRKRQELAKRVSHEEYAEGLLDITRAGFMVRAAWAKIVRADLVREHGLLFPVGKRNEDTDWSAFVFEAATSIRWAPMPFGAYRVGHSTAQTAKPVTDVMVDGLASIISEHATKAFEGGFNELTRHALLAYLAYPFVVWLGQTSALGRTTGDPIFESMRRWAKPLFGAAEDPKVKPAALLYATLGFDATARALGLAFNLLHPEQSGD